MPEYLITGPSAEPLDVNEAKAHMRVSDTSQDSSIARFIAAARMTAEGDTQRQLIHARYAYVADGFPMLGIGGLIPALNTINIPSFAIVLPTSPVERVVSITYLDMAGATQTMPATDYTVNTTMAPCIITPVFGKIWPIALPQIGSVIVTYDAGYASPMTANPATDQITVTGPRTWAVNDVVQFSNSGGDQSSFGAGLPSPLLPRTNYYIKTTPGNGVYTVSATAGGAAIDITAVGTGSNFIGRVPDEFLSWMLLRIGAMFENREGVYTASRAVSIEIEFVEGLLDNYRVIRP